MKSFLNFKILASLFVFVFVVTTSSSSYAQDKGGDAWILLGYSYTEASKSSTKGIYGPLSLTFGGDIWRFIGLEVSLGSRWKIGSDPAVFQATVSDQTISTNLSMSNVLWSFDIKPYLMLQPKFGVDLVSIRPYFGIGPTFSISGIAYTSDIVGASNKSDTTFDVGFSTKLGVRLQALKFLFVGVGAEYMYLNPKINGVNRDLSGFSFGGEVGLIW